MSYLLHQEWFSDHKTTFLGSLSYQKVDFDVFVLQIPSNLAWARSSHQLKWPGFPNISNFLRLENQAQILKTLQIFFLGSAYIYTSRFYVQHVPRINLHRSPTLFMQKLTFTDFFGEAFKYIQSNSYRYNRQNDL